MFRVKRTARGWLRRRATTRVFSVLAVLAVAIGGSVVAATPAVAANNGDVWFEGIIRSMPTGRCLGSNDDGQVFSIPCTFKKNQDWRIRYYEQPPNNWPYMTIQNMQTGRYLTIPDGSPLQSPLTTAPSVTYGSVWEMSPSYQNNWSVYRFKMVLDGFPMNWQYVTNNCADANSPTDTTGQTPWLYPCGSTYGDWHMGY